MSKPWFLKMALEAEPTPLAKQIASALKQAADHVQKPADKLADELASTSLADKDKPTAPGGTVKK